MIGNGGVDRPEDALSMLRETGVDGVMIGRAALGNPWIFRSVREVMQGLVPAEPSPEDRRSMIAEHLDRLVLRMRTSPRTRRSAGRSPECTTVNMFRGHLMAYLAGCRGVLRARRRMNDLRTVSDVMEVVDEVLAAGAGTW